MTVLKPMLPDRGRWPEGEPLEVRQAYDNGGGDEMAEWTRTGPDDDGGSDAQADSDGYHGQGC